jgi:hypothetical protein
VVAIVALAVDPYNGNLTDKESMALLKLLRVHRRFVKNERHSDALILETAINIVYSTLIDFQETVPTIWGEIA